MIRAGRQDGRPAHLSRPGAGRGLAGHGAVSRRAGAMTVQINGLPRVDPFHLERGQLAYEVAFRQMSRALSLQVDEESDLLTLDAET